MKIKTFAAWLADLSVVIFMSRYFKNLNLMFINRRGKFKSGKVTKIEEEHQRAGLVGCSGWGGGRSSLTTFRSANRSSSNLLAFAQVFTHRRHRLLCSTFCDTSPEAPTNKSPDICHECIKLECKHLNSLSSRLRRLL